MIRLYSANLSRISVVAYADDTLVMARERMYTQVKVLAGVSHVVQLIRCLGLEVALHKIEAVAFHGHRSPSGLVIVVGGGHIAVGGTMRYLCPVLGS